MRRGTGNAPLHVSCCCLIGSHAPPIFPATVCCAEIYQLAYRPLGFRAMGTGRSLSWIFATPMCARRRVQIYIASVYLTYTAYTPWSIFIAFDWNAQPGVPALFNTRFNALMLFFRMAFARLIACFLPVR